MEKNKIAKKRPDPERIQIMKILPRELKESLTIEETNAILYEDVLPDSLQEKLKDYLIDD